MPSAKHFSVVLAGVTLISATLSGCLGLGAGTPPLLSRIENVGPVPVSSNNPFLRGNLVVAELVRGNSVFAKFISTHGEPEALEVQTSFFGPLILHLFYSKKAQSYRFEKIGDSWLIDGPHPLPPSFARLGLFNSEHSPGISTEEAMDTGTAPVLSDSLHSETDPFIAGLANSKEAAGFKSVDPKVAAHTQEQERFLEEISKYRSEEERPAELSPGGDLVHYVTFDGETLEHLAAWYTGELENVERLARIGQSVGQIQPGKELELGDQIIIPKYMVKFTNRMPEEVVSVKLPGTE